MEAGGHPFIKNQREKNSDLRDLPKSSLFSGYFKKIFIANWLDDTMKIILFDVSKFQNIKINKYNYYIQEP